MSCTVDSARTEDPVATTARSAGFHETVCFLDLPTELRLQIYELLPISTIVKKVRMWQGHPHAFEFSIVYKGTASPILATCQSINAEASAIMARKMDTMIETAPGILVDLGHLQKLTGTAGPLLHIGSYLCLIAQARTHGNTFSLACTPVARPCVLETEPSDLPSFALTLRKLILIMEKRQTTLQSSSPEPLELEIGLENAAKVSDHSEIFWPHAGFAAPLMHHNQYGVSFRYTIRPVASEFEEEDIDTYYRGRRMQKFAVLAVRGRRIEELPVHVVPGDRITDEEFKGRWSL